jgi:hypothetical protein
MKALALSTALATLVAIGSASAAQPFDLSGDQADRVTAGGGGDFNVNVFKSVQELKLKLIKIKAEVVSKPRIRGNFATAEAAATAKGRNTFTETTGLSDVKQHRSSASFSQATSAATGGGRHP